MPSFRDSQRKRQLEEKSMTRMLSDKEERELKRIESGKPRRKSKAPPGASPKGKTRTKPSKSLGRAKAEIKETRGERRIQSRGGGGAVGAGGPLGGNILIEFDKRLGKFVRRSLKGSGVFTNAEVKQGYRRL